jgi:hypothetical protein
VSAEVKAAMLSMLLQRDYALAAMGRQLLYENSTTMQQRVAGEIVCGSTFFERSVRATSVHHHHASLLKSSVKQVVCFGAWDICASLKSLHDSNTGLQRDRRASLLS